ncbi:CU044_5270 family protein [Streptomyces sp. NPDC001002]
MRNTKERSARRRDVMKTLADARPDELDPVLLAGSRRQREDLARITAEAREETSGPRPLAWLRPRLLPLGAVATVAASAIVVAGLVQTQSDGTTSEQAGTRSPATSASAAVNGRMELLGVAKAAASPAAEGTYWQVSTQTVNVDVVGEKGRRYALLSTAGGEWSVGVRPGTESLMLSGLDATTEPRTPADKKAWTAAGSPRQVEGPAGTDGRMRLGYTIGTSTPTVLHTNADDKIYALGPENITYQDLRQLPTDADKLSGELERLYEQEGGVETSAGRTAWMLRHTADLITMPVAPATRAAAYRVLAELPGIGVQPSATDPLGRKGMAVTLPVDAETVLGGVEQRLVVNPSTGALLSEETVLTAPSAVAREAGLTAGTTVNYEATTRMGWSERQITVPENAKY